jgi:hypothetical protein
LGSLNQLNLIEQNWVLQHAALRDTIFHGFSVQKTYIFEWLTKSFREQNNLLALIKSTISESIKAKEMPEILSQTPMNVETRTNTLKIIQLLPESFDDVKKFITDNLSKLHGKIYDISYMIANEKESNSKRDISLELTNAAINTLGNNLSAL